MIVIKIVEGYLIMNERGRNDILIIYNSNIVLDKLSLFSVSIQYYYLKN